MKTKTYIIDKTEMQLKKLTLKEVKRVNSLLSIQTGTSLSAEVPEDNSPEFLSIVLEPVNENVNKNEIDFEDCTEETALEVLKDFFTSRIERGKNLKSYFTTLAKK